MDANRRAHAAMLPAWYHAGVTNDALSLYLHIPFCDHRCAYCDFNAYAGLDGMMPAYAAALVREIGFWAGNMGPRTVETVFFGGGTPSLLPLPLLEQIIGAVTSGYRVAAGAEWTLEANPGTVDAPYLAALRNLGINRLSIGVQSFDDHELRRLDRIHDAAAAEAAFRAGRAAGFENISLDQIYGLQGQDLAGWERTLDRALALDPDHLSLYALSIEEGTPLAQRVARGDAPEPDPDLQADMYDLARERLAAAGYEHYEISNWARPGRACRHNLVYWRDGEWLGMGAGAHSHLGNVRFAAVNSPARYVRFAGRPADHDLSVRTPARSDCVSRGAVRTNGAGPPREPAACPKGALWAGHPALDEPAWAGRVESLPWLHFVEYQPPAMATADAAILALRLREGLSLPWFERRFGRPFEAVYGESIADLFAAGLLAREGDRLRIPERHWLIANEVFARLMPEHA
jgi:oxygen-independent coproporphyrinogen-3 oxidase